jgi:hypothetical protein
MAIRKTKAPASGTKASKRPVKKPTPAKKAAKSEHMALTTVAAAGSPKNYRARVRMYRHGLGDCFLLSFPRKHGGPFHLLIDCGALSRNKAAMTAMVEHMEKTVAPEGGGKSRLDLVIATHEHKDHLSGFNQARAVFNRMEFGAVWLSWLENLTEQEAQELKKAKRLAVAQLKTALESTVGVSALKDGEAFSGVRALLGFSDDEDTTGTGKIADALEYLKIRGRDAKKLEYREPGEGPLKLDGVDGVRIYVLGPPHDPTLLKGSEVTEQHKRDHIIYHLSHGGVAGLEALNAALASASATTAAASAEAMADDRYQPFGPAHRIPRPGNGKADTFFGQIKEFVDRTYDEPREKWRRIDYDWLGGFDQLALDLDNDTNNTSLVLAFEFEDTGEVLLFVGDAQVGNWLSWEDVEFRLPGVDRKLPAHDLLKRTVFYKVGHHCSHNATLQRGGLELMTSDRLVAFIPLDKETASKQGKHGWDMPAEPLYKALLKHTGKRVYISDVTEKVPEAAKQHGVFADDGNTFIDYYLM